MKQIPILSGKAHVVELPEGAIEPRITQPFGIYLTVNDRFGFNRIKLPPGTWKIVGMLSEVTEEMATTVVKECIDACECTTGYANYNRGDKPKPFCLATALKSLDSAILAEGYDFDSEPEPSYSDCEQYENPMRTYEGRLREWNRRQSRVLDRSRCLLLGRDAEPPDIDYEKEMPHKKWPSTKYAARKVDDESHGRHINDNPRYPLFSHMSSEHGLTLLDSELDEIARHAAPMTGVDYWKRRCEAAERFIAKSPCDPDITNTQEAAYDAWQEIVKQQPK